MIKRFNKFNEDYGNKPGQNVENCIEIKLDKNEVNLFTTEPVLQSLISDQKVSLYSDGIWVNSTDVKTLDILSQYVDIDVKESVISDTKGKAMKELKDLGNRIKDLQKEFDIKSEEVNKMQSYRDKMKSKVEKSKQTLNPERRLKELKKKAN